MSDVAARKAKVYADALRSPLAMPKGQMMGKFYVAPSPIEHLATALRQGLATYNDVSAIDAEEAQRVKDEEGLQTWMGQMPKTQYVEHAGPQPQELEGVPILGTQAPTLQDKMNWVQQGMKNPLAKTLATKYGEDQLIQEPVREEARQFKASEAAATRLATAQQNQERNAARMEEIRVRMEDRALDRASREAMAAEARALQAELGRGNLEIRKMMAETARQTAEDKKAAAAGTAAAGGKSTEGEKASAGYLARMNAAEQLLTETQNGDLSLFQKAVGGIPMVGKDVQPYVLNKNNEKVLQAQRDWVRAKLRKESGAVIGEEEMAEELRTYFPQPGESEDVKKQKAAARQMAGRQLEIGAGAALPQASDPRQTGNAALKPGTVENGYVYLGGDPAQPTSWRKQ